jgi:hypothetical protein
MVTMITIVHSLPLPLSDDVKKYLYINNQTGLFYGNSDNQTLYPAQWTICPSRR